MALSRPAAVFCKLKSENYNNNKKVVVLRAAAAPRDEMMPTVQNSSSDGQNVKIVLQPRLCTLRTYGSDRVGGNSTMIYKIKNKNSSNGGGGGGEGEDGEVSPFFATLSDYIESSKKSEDFEIIFGRLAMIVFAATVTMEIVTGNSLFRKMESEGIAEAVGVCVGAVGCAAIFAWFSSARNKVGRIFTVSCNSFIDSFIDQIVDGLFYEEPTDWSDEI